MNPTDWEVLQILGDGRRHHRANLAKITDKDGDYISQRLSRMYEDDLVHRVGPAERSGEYEIAPRGRATLRDAPTPTENEVTQAPPETPHLSPAAFNILEQLSTEPRTAHELSNATEYTVPYTEAVIDGLRYQHLVESITVTIQKSHADVHFEPTTQDAYTVTDRGETVRANRDAWEANGDPGLKAAITHN